MAWTQSDRADLRRYLNKTDSALISEMLSARPQNKISETSTVDSVALMGAKKEGWDDAVEFLKTLSENADSSKDASNGTFEAM